MNATAPATDTLLDLDEVANRLSISRRSLERLIASGRITSIHLDRRHLIRETEVQRFIAQLTNPEAAR